MYKCLVEQGPYNSATPATIRVSHNTFFINV